MKTKLTEGGVGVGVGGGCLEGLGVSESEMGLRRTETKWVALLRKDCLFPIFTYGTQNLVSSETWDFVLVSTAHLRTR